MNQAHYVIMRLERLNAGKVVLMGHSFGVLVAMVVAALRPDLVERVILISPPGAHVDGLRLWQRMFLKLCADVGHMIWDDSPTRQLLTWASTPGFLAYVLSNPVRTVAEGWRASYFSAFLLLYPQLKANGLKVVIFITEDDILFKATEVRAALRRLGIDDEDIVLMHRIGHDVQFQPFESVAVMVCSGHLPPE